MVKALRQWLEANELPAIIAGVLGTIVLLAVVLVVGRKLIVSTRGPSRWRAYSAASASSSSCLL